MTPLDYRNIGRNLPPDIRYRPYKMPATIELAAKWLHDFLAERITIDKDDYPSSWDGWYDANDELSEAGWTLLGSGFFSAVYHHNDFADLAFKIGFKAEDSGAAYAAWCRDNKGMPHIPDILYLDRFEKFYVVVMPRYQGLDRAGRQAMGAAKAVFHSEEAIYYREELDGHPSVVHTARKIKAFFQGVAKFDLHGQNVMQDKDGVLIITDPVSYQTGKPKFKDDPVLRPLGFIRGRIAGNGPNLQNLPKPHLVDWNGLENIALKRGVVDHIRPFGEAAALARKAEFKMSDLERIAVIQGRVALEVPKHLRQLVERL